MDQIREWRIPKSRVLRMFQGNCNGKGRKREKKGEGSEWACPVFSDSEEGIISGLFGFKVSWGLVVKTGMESGAVVEGFDVMEDGATRFGQGGEAVVVNQFVFEAAPKRLNESVVVTVALASHGSD